MVDIGLSCPLLWPIFPGKSVLSVNSILLDLPWFILASKLFAGYVYACHSAFLIREVEEGFALLCIGSDSLSSTSIMSLLLICLSWIATFFWVVYVIPAAICDFSWFSSGVLSSLGCWLTGSSRLVGSVEDWSRAWSKFPDGFSVVLPRVGFPVWMGCIWFLERVWPSSSLDKTPAASSDRG